jgi:hypothetical protein
MGASSFGTADNVNGGGSGLGATPEEEGNGAVLDTSSPKLSTRMSRQNSGVSAGGASLSEGSGSVDTKGSRKKEKKEKGLLGRSK